MAVERWSGAERERNAVILSGAEALRSAVEGPLTPGGGGGGGLVGGEVPNDS